MPSHAPCHGPCAFPATCCAVCNSASTSEGASQGGTRLCGAGAPRPASQWRAHNRHSDALCCGVEAETSARHQPSVHGHHARPDEDMQQPCRNTGGPFGAGQLLHGSVPGGAMTWLCTCSPGQTCRPGRTCCRHNGRPAHCPCSMEAACQFRARSHNRHAYRSAAPPVLQSGHWHSFAADLQVRHQAQQSCLGRAAGLCPALLPLSSIAASVRTDLNRTGRHNNRQLC